MIDGVKITPLRQIVDERGKVMHMLRSDSPLFEKFGEIYFSTVNYGAVKAWHLHRRMTLNYAVPYGLIKLVLRDWRHTSPTFKEVQEIFLGPDNYYLVTIPPLVWNGFKGIALTGSVVANCSTVPHDPEEIERLPHDHPGFGYDWSVSHG